MQDKTERRRDYKSESENRASGRATISLPKDLMKQAKARANAVGLKFANYIAAIIQRDLGLPNAIDGLGKMPEVKQQTSGKINLKQQRLKHIEEAFKKKEEPKIKAHVMS